MIIKIYLNFTISVSFMILVSIKHEIFSHWVNQSTGNFQVFVFVFYMQIDPGIQGYCSSAVMSFSWEGSR